VHTSLRKKYCHMQWERKGERGRRERIWMSDKWQNNSLKCSWERNPGKEYCGWLLIGCFAFCCCFSFVCLFVSLLAFDTGWPGTHNPLASAFWMSGLQACDISFYEWSLHSYYYNFSGTSNLLLIKKKHLKMSLFVNDNLLYLEI
jgi:hypothetical protein